MVLVRSAPQYLTHDDIEPAVIEMAGYLLQNKNDINSQHMDWIYHNVSCRAAIKAGNLSHPQELIDLARRLEEDSTIRYCPHGRPISIIIKRREIENNSAGCDLTLNKIPLIAVVGPTASGKTALGVAIAKNTAGKLSLPIPCRFTRAWISRRQSLHYRKCRESRII